MSGDTNKNLHECLTDIARADTSGDYKKALQAAERMIRRYPKEVYAYKCKLVALIQLGQNDDALAFIKKTPNHMMGDCGFEKAYLQYRLGQNAEALETLGLCPKDDIRAKELFAQICYKLERFQEAYDSLSDLLRNHSDSFDEERKANFLAVQTQLEYLGVRQQIATNLDTYEEYYNAACHNIEVKDWEKALNNLDKALKLCRETLVEEGLTEEEMDDELAIIRVQYAFVLHKLARRQEACEMYNKVLHSSSSDVSVRATLTNNLPGSSKEYNLADARKKFKNALHLDQNKLTSRQRQTLMLNNALLLLVSNQREPCRRALQELKEIYGQSKDSCLIESALLVKTGDIDKALLLLEESDIEFFLSRIHILVNAGRLDDALTVIGSLPEDLKSRPGVLNLKIGCLEAAGNKDEASLQIRNGLKLCGGTADRQALLNQGCQLEMDKGDVQAAAAYLEQLSSILPDDISVKCRLIRLYSTFDASKAEQLSSKIFPASTNDNIDADELEESDWILYGEKYRQKKETKMEVDDTEIVTRKLKNVKRKRKIRLPKNYDPNVAPDPERWLPRSERAAYKKKGKKNRERDIGRGTQGSASANPNVEYTTVSPNSPRPLATPAEGPRQQRPKQIKKKKKAGKF